MKYIIYALLILSLPALAQRVSTIQLLTNALNEALEPHYLECEVSRVDGDFVVTCGQIDLSGYTCWIEHDDWTETNGWRMATRICKPTGEVFKA